MMFLSKQAICDRLAESLLPRQPFLELRKLRIKEAVSETVHKMLFYHYHKAEKTHECFDPPRPYLNHPTLPEFEFNHSIDKLSDKDRELLNEIAPLDGSIFESADSFNGYYQKFIGSDKKPDWYLVRVLVSDTLENYQARHKEYERLLNGGLNAWVNRGYVLKLGEDEYEFRREKPIADTAILLDRTIYFYAAHPLMGESLAAYNTRQHNPTRSEPETKKFAMQINAMIDKALYNGELPVYRRPAYLRVEYAYPVNKDDVIRWHDLKALLESKTGQGLPEYPVFMSWWPEIESAMEAQGQGGEPKTKAVIDGKNIRTGGYRERDLDAAEWYKTKKPEKVENMTVEQIHTELKARNSMWNKGFHDWNRNQLIWPKKKPGVKPQNPIASYAVKK